MKYAPIHPSLHDRQDLNTAGSSKPFAIMNSVEEMASVQDLVPAERLPGPCRRLPGPLPDAMEPGIHGVRAHWIRGFMAFRLARTHETVMPMVLVRPESSSRERGARPPPIS